MFFLAKHVFFKGGEQRVFDESSFVPFIKMIIKDLIGDKIPIRSLISEKNSNDTMNLKWDQNSRIGLTKVV